MLDCCKWRYKVRQGKVQYIQHVHICISKLIFYLPISSKVFRNNNPSLTKSTWGPLQWKYMLALFKLSTPMVVYWHCNMSKLSQLNINNVEICAQQPTYDEWILCECCQKNREIFSIQPLTINISTFNRHKRQSKLLLLDASFYPRKSQKFVFRSGSAQIRWGAHGTPETC